MIEQVRDHYVRLGRGSSVHRAKENMTRINSSLQGGEREREREREREEGRQWAVLENGFRIGIELKVRNCFGD